MRQEFGKYVFYDDPGILIDTVRRKIVDPATVTFTGMTGDEKAQLQSLVKYLRHPIEISPNDFVYFFPELNVQDDMHRCPRCRASYHWSKAACRKHFKNCLGRYRGSVITKGHTTQFLWPTTREQRFFQILSPNYANSPAPDADFASSEEEELVEPLDNEPEDAPQVGDAEGIADAWDDWPISGMWVPDQDPPQTGNEPTFIASLGWMEFIQEHGDSLKEIWANIGETPSDDSLQLALIRLAVMESALGAKHRVHSAPKKFRNMFSNKNCFGGPVTPKLSLATDSVEFKTAMEVFSNLLLTLCALFVVEDWIDWPLSAELPLRTLIQWFQQSATEVSRSRLGNFEIIRGSFAVPEAVRKAIFEIVMSMLSRECLDTTQGAYPGELNHPMFAALLTMLYDFDSGEFPDQERLQEALEGIMFCVRFFSGSFVFQRDANHVEKFAREHLRIDSISFYARFFYVHRINLKHQEGWSRVDLSESMSEE